MDDNQPLNVWQWFEEKHWQYLPFHGGYQSPCGRFFITEEICYLIPGDIMHFLKTGHVRNIRMFDSRWQNANAKQLGFKQHKDGTCVQLKVIK